MFNSVIITVLTTTATMAFGVPAGYAFARGRFLGKRFLAGWLLFSVDTINWGALAAAALTLVVPVFIVTLFVQRGLLRGLSAGAVKG